MSTLRSGNAPLRGRASLELVVDPFNYPETATFWEVGNDFELAVKLLALVGGTPGYLDMCGGARPRSAADLDRWVIATLVNPASAIFQEGNILLAEEPGMSDRTLYLAVLAALSRGATRRGEMAAALGRTETSRAHPLSVLSQTHLVSPLSDAPRPRRTTYHIAEPVLRFHQLVIAPNEAWTAATPCSRRLEGGFRYGLISDLWTAP